MRTNPTRREGFQRQERLRSRSDLNRVFRASRQVGCKGQRLLYRANGLGCNRIVITTTRGFKGAVNRNRQKRIGREIYRRMKAGLKQGFDFVSILYPGQYTYIEREKQFHRLFQCAELLE